MQGGGHPADVPAVARGDQGQQPDRGVFGRVQRPRPVRLLEPGHAQELRGERVDHRTRGQGRLRQVQWGHVEDLPAAQPPLIAGDPSGHLHVRQRQGHGPGRHRLQRLHEVDRHLLSRGGRPLRHLGVTQRQSLVEVEFVDDERLALVQVQRAGVDLRAGADGVDSAEHPAVHRVHDHHLRAALAADVDLGVRGVVVGGRVPAGGPAAHEAARGEVLEHLGRAPGPRLVVRHRPLAHGAPQLPGQQDGVAGVGDGGLDGPAQQGLGVMDEVSVQRVVARDQHDQRALAAAPGAPGLLPERGDGAREPRAHHGVEAGDVHAQLERGRRGHAHQLALGEAAFEFAAVVGEVARAVGGDAAGELESARPVFRGEALAGAQRGGFGAGAGPDERQGARALGDEGGHDRRRLDGRGSADGRAVLAGQPLHQRRFPQGDGAAALGRGVVGDLDALPADEGGGGGPGVGGGGGGQDEGRRRAHGAGEPVEPS